MTTRHQLRAEGALAAYTRRHKQRTLTGALGNNAGTVEHPTRDGWVWVRLHGDSNQVILAYCAVAVPLTANLVVALEKVERSASSFYQVIGIATSIVYPDNDYTGAIGAHAEQHQRRDLGESGFDPLDVYTRALIGLRARAQAVPDDTLYVEVGWYDNGGQRTKWAGGNSPAFSIPAAGPLVVTRRCDLLYMGTDDALHIETGTATTDGTQPGYPATPLDCVAPLAMVFLDSTMATITEEYIEDCRALGASTIGSVSPGIGWFNVVDYGAVGDGVTDDRAAINLAIAAYNAAGGVLYFPHPSVAYYSSDAFTALAAPGTVLGDGSSSYFDSDVSITAGTLITCDNRTANLFTVSSYGVNFRGLMIQNTAALAPTAGAGILVNNGDYAIYEDLNLQSFYVDMYIADGAEWKIDNCVFYEPVTYALRVVHTDFSGDFGDWCISNCTFFPGDRDSDAAIRYESGGGGKITNCKINGWYNSPPVGTAFAYGIDLAVQSSTSILLVSNCSIENVRTSGIRVTNVALKTWIGIQIANCEFGMYGATGEAIKISATASGDVSYVVVTGCVFLGNGLLPECIDITNVDHVRLSNNVYNATFYTTLYTATTCNDVIVTGPGTVTSVALTAPAQFAVGGSPVTGAGTLAVTWQNQTANRVLAGPAVGAAAAPTFRALVAADIAGIAPGSEWSVLTAEVIEWEDMRIAGAMTRVGVTAPSLDTFGPSGNLKVLHFDEAQHDEIHFEIQMPHSWKVGTKIYPHVHWTPVTAEAGNVVWQLEYSWQDINGTFGAPSNMTSDATAAGGTAWVHKLTYLKDGGGNNYIDGTGFTTSSMIVCRLHRDAGAGSDTLSEDVAFLEFDLHYQVDGLGSDAESSKSADTRYGPVYADGDIVMCETLR